MYKEILRETVKDTVDDLLIMGEEGGLASILDGGDQFFITYYELMDDDGRNKHYSAANTQYAITREAAEVIFRERLASDDPFKYWGVKS